MFGHQIIIINLVLKVVGYELFCEIRNLKNNDKRDNLAKDGGKCL